MTNVVIGIDLGTSAVKVVMMNQENEIIAQSSRPYTLIEERDGFVEQRPNDWVQQTIEGLKQLAIQQPSVIVDGISFSGQMHGLVLINEAGEPLRNAILWNDTRTTKQCREIEQVLGERLYDITKNDALEGETLPKIMWVKEHEPVLFEKAYKFLLPKDYLRFKLTNHLAMEPTDAAGTLLFDVATRQWSEEVCDALHIPFSLCPQLIDSHEISASLNEEVAAYFNNTRPIPVFAGGADNACGALGAGIVSTNQALVSIGTSGVVLSPSESVNYVGNYIHTFSYFNEASQYFMGVTLAAGESLRWYRSAFAPNIDFDELLADLPKVSAGANGLLFTPYLFGERTPYGDAKVRASFLGMKNSHERAHFTRAVIEGITYSLKQSFDLIKVQNPTIERITCIGGAAKNPTWMQIVADVFGYPVAKLKEEQGPALGAAMVAAVGAGWFSSFDEAVNNCVEIAEVFEPNVETHARYKKYYECYKDVYAQTAAISSRLLEIE